MKKKIFGILILALCITMSVMLIGCKPTITPKTDAELYDIAVTENIAKNGFSLDSISIQAGTENEVGYVKKSVTVDGDTATTNVSEKKLSEIIVGGVNDGKYDIITSEPVITSGYTGERISNLITFASVVEDGRSLTREANVITLNGVSANIASTLNIADATGITNCNVTVCVDVTSNTVLSYVIVYSQGSTNTTLTYTQTA